MDQNKRRKVADLDMYGKVPPQAKELEEAVLGACMIERDAFELASAILKPEAFYMDANKKIFDAMVTLTAQNMPVDLLTVVEELKSKGDLDAVGGPYNVTKLTNAVVSSANIEAHARIVLEKYMLRELIRIGGEVIGDAFDAGTDVFDLLDKTEKQLGVINSTTTQEYEEVRDTVLDTMMIIETQRQENSTITGITTGFRELDVLTAGWQRTDLIILAARPSVGKTAFALNLARNCSKDPKYGGAVGFFSIEMSKNQLNQRLLSAEAEIGLEKISRGTVTDLEFKVLTEKGLKPLQNSRIYIDDSSTLNIFQLRTKARKMKKKGDIQLLIIDYLQLMNGMQTKNDNREQEISKISRELKQLAKELQVPIIALSQLSREVEKRKDRTPILSDLRESGAIEQDADMVMFLYRDEYYDIKHDENGTKKDGETLVKVAKHRNGELRTIKLTSRLRVQKFYNFGEAPDVQASSLPPGNWVPIARKIDPDDDDDKPF